MTDVITLDRWDVETSHLIQYPSSFHTDSIGSLRRDLQNLANERGTRMPFGDLSFRYEFADDSELAVVVHAYFTNRHNKLQRFMRLRRIPDHAAR